MKRLTNKQKKLFHTNDAGDIETKDGHFKVVPNWNGGAHPDGYEVYRDDELVAVLDRPNDAVYFIAHCYY